MVNAKMLDDLKNKKYKAYQLRSMFGEGMVEKKGAKDIIADFFIYLFILIVMFICIIPLWHCCMCSISDGKTLLGHEGLVLWPVGDTTLDGYKYVFKDNTMLRGYLNTIIYVVGSCALGFLINVLGGYVLCRKSKLKSVLSIFLIMTTMFTGGTVPLFMVVYHLGMVGTPLALIVPGCTNAMFTILCMNSFLGVPESTVEAARIDGAGHLTTMFRVMLPQAMGMILVTIINTAILSWNAWYQASIYVPTEPDLWPLQLIIKEKVANSTDFLNYSNPDYARYLIQYCVIMVATLPVLVLFPFFQKRLQKGMLMGAVKE
ncbi:MAG: carbohydrate ABC transporter permease [Gammaproteobacteria bacterium]|nr:carbohydrate ABC transporter permease [Gammaproteobacteria bacterium]